MLDNIATLPGFEEEIESIRKLANLSEDELFLIDEIKNQYDDEIKELLASFAHYCVQRKK